MAILLQSRRKSRDFIFQPRSQRYGQIQLSRFGKGLDAQGRLSGAMGHKVSDGALQSVRGSLQGGLITARGRLPELGDGVCVVVEKDVDDFLQERHIAVHALQRDVQVVDPLRSA